MAARKDDALSVRIGLELEGRRAAREGCEVLLGENRVGRGDQRDVCSTVEKSISMAYVHPEVAVVGTS